MKIRVLERVKAFPFNGYRFVCRSPDVNFITAEHSCDGTEFFCLHLKDGNTATYNTNDYVMEFQPNVII